MDRQQEFVLRTLEERDIRFVRLWFTDVLGTLKSVSVAPAELEAAFDEGIGFDGSAIEGFARVFESDMVAMPDPTTFQVFPFEGGGLHNLAGMTRCEDLFLSYTHANDAGLKYLGKLANLTRLRLANTDVTDEGLAALAGMKKLAALDLGDTHVKGDGLKHLAGCKALTVDDLAVTDQFHGGGKASTVRLARRLDPRPGTRVLDVGGGLGGPARTLALEYGCHVTVVDVTTSFVRAGQMLTDRLGLADRVTHRVGNALELPFDGGAFDVVWTQNSGMGIADKDRLYRGFHRVLRPGGRVALQEPVAGPVQPPVYPLMWATEPSGSFLVPPHELRATIERAGFAVSAWDDVTAETAGPHNADAIPAHSAQRVIMGGALDAIIRANHRNRTETRIASIQAIVERR